MRAFFHGVNVTTKDQEALSRPAISSVLFYQGAEVATAVWISKDLLALVAFTVVSPYTDLDTLETTTYQIFDVSTYSKRRLSKNSVLNMLVARSYRGDPSIKVGLANCIHKHANIYRDFLV